MSATSGIEIPALIWGSASALASSGTVTRTMSQPATSRFRIWFSVPQTSVVLVVVIDWTVIGESPPIGTDPTWTVRVVRRVVMRRERYRPPPLRTRRNGRLLQHVEDERRARPAEAGVRHAP